MMKMSKRFIREYKLRFKEITPELLIGILKSQGFTVIEFNPCKNDEDVEKLFAMLGLPALKDISVPAFTYSDKDNKFVFIRNTLNSSDLTFALLHEEGHIFGEHNFKDGFANNTQIQKEQEATIFAEEVQSFRKRKRKELIIHSSVLTIVIVLMIIAAHYKVLQTPDTIRTKTDTINAAPIAEEVISDKEECEFVYITPSGERYHTRNCGYTRDRKDITELTIEAAEDEGYSPCYYCILS